MSRINIKFQGGIGNQMFQYALGITMFAAGHDVTYDASALDMEGEETSVHNRCKPSYGLRGFDTRVKFGKPVGKVHSTGDPAFNPKILQIDYDATLEGFWQSEKYFTPPVVANRLVFEFFPRTMWADDRIKTFSAAIAGDNSVGVQIRRGDYVQHKDFHGLMTKEYFEEGIRIANKPNVFIWTDDEAWAKNAFPGATIANTGNRHWDIALMAGCHSMVVSNSTYGWWGAWLGDSNFIKPGRKVIAPEQWFQTKYISGADIVPERWIKI